MSAYQHFTKERYERLKQAYKEAVKSGKETFFFDGQELLVSYAKYLIEYLELNKHKLL